MEIRAEHVVRAHLDDLADWVAQRLDAGDAATAWEVASALARAADLPWAGEARPPAPAIGRRFAQAHRAVLAGVGAEDGALALAALAVTGEGAAARAADSCVGPASHASWALKFT